MYNFGMQSTNPTFNPYEPQRYQPMSFNQNSLVRVTGIEGAKAYQMSPNSTVALFDNNEDYFYVKTTDGAGFPTIRTFEFKEVSQDRMPGSTDYVKRSEFEELKEAIINGKYIISEPNTEPKTSINQSTSADGIKLLEG